MRRALRWILVVGGVLCLLAVAGVQAVLWSDLPRRVAESAARDRVGLDVSLGGLRVGWGGSVRVEQLRVYLPLDDEPLVVVDGVRLEVTSLPAMALGWGVTLHRADARGLRVRAVERPDGGWNLLEAAETVRAALPEPGEDDGGVPPLPRIGVRDAVVRVERVGRPAVELDAISVELEPDGVLGARAVIRQGEAVWAESRVALAPPWRHKVEAEVRLTPRWRELLGLGPEDQGEVGLGWAGQWADGVVRGRLTLDDGVWRGMSVSGALDARVEPGAKLLRLEPAAGGLGVTGGGLPEPLAWVGGGVVLTPDGFTLEELMLRSLGGSARVSASGGWDGASGRAEAAWSELSGSARFAERGALDVSWSGAPAGPVRLRGRWSGGGEPAGFAWSGGGPIRGVWRGGGVGSVTAELEEALFRGAGWDVSPMTGSIEAAITPETATLRRLSLSGPGGLRLDAGAELLRASGQWSGELTAGSVPLPTREPRRLERVSAKLGGTADRAVIEELLVRGLGLEVKAAGSYVPSRDLPLTATLELDHTPLGLERGGEPWLVAERLGGRFEATGALVPVDVSARGTLVAKAVALGGRALGDVSVLVQGQASSEAVTTRVEAIEWLGGRWSLVGRWAGEQPGVRVETQAHGVDLGRLTELVGSPGLADGELGLSVAVTLPSDDVMQAAVVGGFEIEPLTIAGFGADRAEGRLGVSGGEARVTELVVRRGEGRLTGSGSVGLTGTPWYEAALRAEAMPVAWEGAPGWESVLDGELAFELTPDPWRGDGSASGQAVLRRGGEALASLRGEAVLSGRIISVDALTGELFGGEVTGSGRLPLERWLETRADLSWDGVALDRLAATWPAVEGLEGAVAGELTVAPTERSRALGPLRLDLSVRSRDAGYGGLTVRDLRATAFADTGRFVLETLNLETARGSAELWGRLTSHAGEWYGYSSMGFDQLDLGVLARSLGDAEQDLQGRIGGRLTVSSPLRDWDRAFGRGSLTLSGSDLARVPLFTLLYEIGNVSLFSREPRGSGRADFRIEDGVLVFDRFRYSNRGLQVRLVGRVADVWEGGESPIAGYAVLSLKPLPDVMVLSTLNDAFEAVQADATALRLGGTLGSPSANAAAFGELRKMLSDLLRGQTAPEAPTIIEPGAEPEVDGVDPTGSGGAGSDRGAAPASGSDPPANSSP